jgi:transcription elongation factor GreA
MNPTKLTFHPEVHLGCSVSFTDPDLGAQQTFTLVGPYESSPSEGRLSIISPIGRALVGHRVGDLVQVHTPRGVRPLLIGAIS